MAAIVIFTPGSFVIGHCDLKTFATLVTEHILFWLCIVMFRFSFLIDVISVILLMV